MKTLLIIAAAILLSSCAAIKSPHPYDYSHVFEVVTLDSTSMTQYEIAYYKNEIAKQELQWKRK